MIIFTSINLVEGLERKQHEGMNPTVLADSQYKDGDTDRSVNTQIGETGNGPNHSSLLTKNKICCLSGTFLFPKCLFLALAAVS